MNKITPFPRSQFHKKLLPLSQFSHTTQTPDIHMKKTLFILIATTVLASCTSKKNSQEWWLGTFSNDTVSLIINPEGVCRIVTADTSIGAEYVWDVDNSALLVTDEHGGLHLFRVDGKTFISAEGSRFSKKDQ